MIRLWLCLGLMAVLVVGCGGGGGGGGSAPSGYLVLDLETGEQTRHAAIADLMTNPQYQDQFMVFTVVPVGDLAAGTRGQIDGIDLADDLATASVASIACAVFETTQAQWFRLTEDRPWRAIQLGQGVTEADGLPATAIARSMIDTVSARWPLRLPTSAEWRYAAQADGPGVLPWGDDLQTATVALHAVLASTRSGNEPEPVGGRQANGFGLYDMIGNVWEWTADAGLAGGSWASTPIIARTGNRIAADETTEAATVGVRFVLRP